MISMQRTTAGDTDAPTAGAEGAQAPAQAQRTGPPLWEAERPVVSRRLGDSRWVSIYGAHAAFSLTDELAHLTRRSIEPNPFFEPRFLVPAMPRLDRRTVRLIVARDEADGRSRLRFFMPFSVESMAPLMRRRAIRAWTHPFGRLGALPLDGDDPEATAASLFSALCDPAYDLPPVLVLPDLPLEGAFAGVVARTAGARGLAVRVTDRTDRAILDASAAPEGGLRAILGADAFRDHRRRLRGLGEFGPVRFEVAADEPSVRNAFEDFLYLEASGWKGRAGSALLQDRHRGAFAREAVNGLAAQDGARVYTLRLDGEAVGSLVVLVSGGEAAAWKTAFEERFRRHRPGALVAALATEAMLADRAIRSVDSCAVTDHGLLNALWRGRRAIGTLVVALKPEANRLVPDIAADIERRRTRLEMRWRLRSGLERLRGALRARPS